MQASGSACLSCNSLHSLIHNQSSTHFTVQVSAYVTAAHIKFLLLHDGRNEEAIKGFFRDVYEAYLRVRAACSGSFLCLAPASRLVSNCNCVGAVLSGAACSQGGCRRR